MDAIRHLAAAVDAAFETRAELTPERARPEVRAAVERTLDLLDTGQLRVAEKRDGQWRVNEWLKKAVLLSFRLYDNRVADAGYTRFFDRVPLKYAKHTDARFRAEGVRVVPPAVVRRGAYVAPNAVLMPSYVNVGAWIGEGSMVDTWATVGSCAQIGRNVHLSGGVGIGGVLEPPNAVPVVIEDDCMIGSRCMITQGARVGRGSILGEATVLNKGIPVIDAETGEEVGRGVVPADCIVVRADRKKEFPGGDFYLPCALIIRRIQPGERTHLNDILRESGISVS